MHSLNSIISTGFEHIKKDYLRKKAQQNESKCNTVKMESEGQTLNVIINKPKDKEFKMKVRSKESNYRRKKDETEDEDYEEQRVILSKKRLLAKSKVYDKLTHTLPNDDINSLYSVDFQRKYLENDDSGKEEEYKEYPDKELKVSEAVHFQEVFGDEARELGVGYYKFSTDEEERQKQMAEFERMAREREQIRSNNPELQAKIRLKYREKVLSHMQKRDIKYLTEEKIEILIDAQIDRERRKREDLIRRLMDDKEAFEEYKKEHPRDWDIYKMRDELPEERILDIPRRPSKFNQGEWVKKQREERNPEFAPPTELYSNDGRNRQNYSPERYRRSPSYTPMDGSNSNEISYSTQNNFSTRYNKSRSHKSKSRSPPDLRQENADDFITSACRISQTR